VNAPTVGKQFILAGRAIFTIVGNTTRFTFKVSRVDPTPDSPHGSTRYFVALMTGTDNETSYDYLGVLDPHSGGVRMTKGSKVRDDHPAVAAIRWTLRHIWATGTLPQGEIHHAGRCGRCGRLLTDPASIRTGFGPECRTRLGVPLAANEAAVGV
jgi:hypothetical protein